MQYPVIDVEETGKRIREICDLRGIQAREIRDYMNFAAMQSVYDWFRGRICRRWIICMHCQGSWRFRLIL